MSNLMTKLAVTGLISTSLLLSPSVFAGHQVNHHSNYNNYHKKHYKSHKRHHHSKHHHLKHRYKRHHKHRHNHTGEIIGGIIGGVVIGSILSDVASHHNTHVTTTYSKPHYGHGYRTTVYQPPVAVNKTIIVNNTPTQTYRVLNGTDCYLVNYNHAGSEVLTQVPGVNCGF